MDPSAQKSILQMARGAIQERADYEIHRAVNSKRPAGCAATRRAKGKTRQSKVHL